MSARGSPGCLWLTEGCPSHKAWVRWNRRQPHLAFLIAPHLFLMLVWFNSSQGLELESENHRHSLWNVCLVVLVCPSSSLACRFQVYQRTFCSVESPRTKRKVLQLFANILPYLYEQPYTKKH